LAFLVSSVFLPDITYAGSVLLTSLPSYLSLRFLTSAVGVGCGANYFFSVVLFSMATGLACPGYAHPNTASLFKSFKTQSICSFPLTRFTNVYFATRTEFLNVI
jgi:hypothetical protein